MECAIIDWGYFDGEETNETYAEQVTRCPECGKWLVKLTHNEVWRTRCPNSHCIDCVERTADGRAVLSVS
jgi:uncharacterized protein with PIN domain